MIHFFKKGDSLDDVVIYNGYDIDDFLDTTYSSNEYFKCINEEDLFLKLLYLFPREPYWNIHRKINSLGVSASKDFLIKSYCSKSNRLQHYQGEDLILLFKDSSSKLGAELAAICMPFEYRDDFIQDILFELKIKKEMLPFFLSLFLNKFTSRDFYFCFKNITGIKNIPTINYSSPEFFIVKFKSKIISYHVSEETAMRASKMIDEIKNDKMNLNVNKVKIDGYESLLNEIDNSKIQKTSDFEKYMIDFDWYFDYCISKKYIDTKNFDFENDVFLIRDKNGETISKEDSKEMYDYIKENKLYSEDIFYLKNSDIDYNSTIKFFDLFKKEVSYDEALTSYLNNIDYLEKVYILNSIIEELKKVKQKENIHYSLIQLDNSEFRLFFFSEINYFHKHMTSLDYGINNASYGELNSTSLRNILKPILLEKNKNNKVLSRADVALNISNLFTKDTFTGDYLKPLKEMDFIIDVDAYLKNGKSSCGIVIRNSSNEITEKISRKLDANTSVEAEIQGAMFALVYIFSLKSDIKNICIRYDCFSVADYIFSTPTSDLGSKYQNLVRKLLSEHNDVNIYIKKVRGHSNDFFNDIADSLASNFFND